MSDRDLFRSRIMAAVEEAQLQGPFDGAPNGVFLDRAWAKGAEFMAKEALKIYDSIERSETPD